MDEAHLAQAVFARVGLGDLERGGAGVGGDHLRQRALAGDGQGDGAAAGAQVRDPRRCVGRQAVQGQFDQAFGLGARDQRGGADPQVQRPEAAPAGDVGDRLAGRTPRQQRGVGVVHGGSARVGAMREQPGAVAAQGVQQQKLGLEARRVAAQPCGAVPQQRVQAFG